MPRLLQPKPETEQISLRLPVAWFARAEKLAATMSRSHRTYARADAFREAIARGLDMLEQEQGIGVAGEMLVTRQPGRVLERQGLALTSGDVTRERKRTKRKKGTRR